MVKTSTGTVQKDDSQKPSAKMLGLLRKLKTQNERTYQEKVQKWNLDFRKQHALSEKYEANCSDQGGSILDPPHILESINNRQVDMV